MTLTPSPKFPMQPPGLVLVEVIGNMAITKTALADKLGVTRKALYDVLDGSSGITPKMALALEREVGSSAEFWLRLQNNFDLWTERKAAAAPRKSKKNVA